jgi:RIO kinase 1
LARVLPDWLITDDFTDADLGVLKTGKEAEISLVERTSLDDPERSHLLARKRYRPRTVTHKGELQALGFVRAGSFRHDLEYRDGRNYGRRSRDRRAVETMTRYGKELVKTRWLGHEYEVMSRLWAAGIAVPYPVAYTEDGGMLVEYLGDPVTGAAPRLAQARLDAVDIRRAWDQVLDNVRRLTAEGIVHADLSPYNVLWFDDQAWLIDFPQSVDLFHSPHGFDFLHRDVVNVCRFFARRGIAEADDADAVYAEVLTWM